MVLDSKVINRQHGKCIHKKDFGVQVPGQKVDLDALYCSPCGTLMGKK